MPHVHLRPGGSGAAVIQAAVEDDAGADAGAEGGVEHIAIACARSPQRFGETGCIGVVVEFHRQRIQPLGLASQRKIAPALGRFGGLMTTPVAGSSGPGEQIPIP